MGLCTGRGGCEGRLFPAPLHTPCFLWSFCPQFFTHSVTFSFICKESPVLGGSSSLVLMFVSGRGDLAQSSTWEQTESHELGPHVGHH